MKFCVSSKQPLPVLKKAEEIRLDYKDIASIYNFIKEEQLKDKEYIIRIEKNTNVNWKELTVLNSKVNLRLELEDIKDAENFKNIKFFWAYPVSTFYELNGLMRLGVEEVRVNAPLFFDLKEVKTKKVKVRAYANYCYDNFIPREEGVCGTYIRPEDVDTYDTYVDTIEFYSEDDLTKEETLLNIYKFEKSWPGNLNLLLFNLNRNVDNRAIPPQFAEARIQCRQNCMRAGQCRMCYSVMNLVNTIDKKIKR